MNGSRTDRLNEMRLFTVKICNMDKWQPLKNFFIQFIKIISQLFTKNVIKKYLFLSGFMEQETKKKNQRSVFSRKSDFYKVMLLLNPFDFEKNGWR